MLCNIYKSQKKQDTYVFVDAEADPLDKLPENLKQILGNLELAMELDITPQRKLAREDAEVVLKNIEEQGFHLQLPPPNHIPDII